jgi:hypothetical protein
VVGEQEVEMPGVLRTRDSLRAVEIHPQPLDPDPPLDQSQDIGAGVVSLEHDPREVDESPDRCLDVAPAAALELLAFALHGPVGGAKRPIEDLERVVGRAVHGLHAEGHQHGVAALGRDSRQRLVGLLAAGLRQPRPPVRRPRRDRTGRRRSAR